MRRPFRSVPGSGEQTRDKAREAKAGNANCAGRGERRAAAERPPYCPAWPGGRMGVKN